MSPERVSPCATIHGHIHRVPARLAASVNTAASHGFELDELDMAGLVPPGCVVVPVVFALGASGRANGKVVITAVVAS